MKPYIVIGGGGHAGVVTDVLIAGGQSVKGLVDPALAVGPHPKLGYPVLGGDEYVRGLSPGDASLANGIGFMPGNALRVDVYDRFVAAGWTFPAITHPTAWASESAELSVGSQLMAGVLVQGRANIGPNTIINTGAIIEHDVVIGGNAHVAPGATICGDAVIGDSVFVGANATVIQGVSIGAGAVVGAGSVVVRDVEPGARVVGTPAGPL